MAVFEYRAKDRNGTYATGRLEAEDEERVWWDLRASGLYPVKVRMVKQKARRHLLSAGRIALFSRALSVMLHSGVPLVRAIGLLAKKEKSTAMKGIYSNLYDRLTAGAEFSDALKSQKGVFPIFFISMFRAGEMNGRLTETAEQMKLYYEKEDHLQKKLETAMVYPAFLFMTMMAAMFLLFTKILPGFFQMYEELETLPLTTRILMSISRRLTDGLPVTVMVILTSLVLILWLLSLPSVKQMKDRLVLHLPLCGKLFRTIATARFARTFGFLYAEGVPIITALEIASDVMGNSWIRNKFQRVIGNVCDGMPLSAALGTVTEFDKELLNSIYIGEETGQLSSLTVEMAVIYDREAETAAERLTTLVEPVMIVLMGIMIGFIMLSVMVPIYQYYQNIG